MINNLFTGLLIADFIETLRVPKPHKTRKEPTKTPPNPPQTARKVVSGWFGMGFGVFSKGLGGFGVVLGPPVGFNTELDL